MEVKQAEIGQKNIRNMPVKYKKNPTIGNFSTLKKAVIISKLDYATLHPSNSHLDTIIKQLNIHLGVKIAYLYFYRSYFIEHVFFSAP